MRGWANLVGLLAVLSVAVVLLGWLGRWHFFFDLASHFRVQATATLLLAGLLLWPLHRRRGSAACLLGGLVLLASLMPFLWPQSRAGSGAYRLLTLNVLTGNSRQDLVIRSIIEHDPDFILLQETNARWIESLDEALADAWPYSKSVPRSDNFGIAIYSKLPWSSCEVLEYSAETATPSISAMFQLPGGGPLRIIATHPLPPISASHWQARNSLLAALASDVRSVIPERTVVAGDLNCSPWSHWFGRFVRVSGLSDAAIGRGLSNTWMPTRIPGLGLPIDHVLIGDKIRVWQRMVGTDVGSDHRPLIVDFDGQP